ncbi:MAG: glycosyltransferase [bacterium]|nr:glycosyltransferase [bacterium]
MKISLVLATANRTVEPERFLASLAAQTCRDFDLVVVDQNADDRVVRLLEPHRDRFPLVHLHSPPGASRARNAGLQQATGDIVGFPDDDCWYPTNLLEGVARFFEAHPEWDGLVVRSVDERGAASMIRGAPGEVRVTRHNAGWLVVTYALFVRRRFIEQAGGFDPHLATGAGTPWGAGEDTDYVLRGMAAGMRVFYTSALAVCHSPAVRAYDRQARARALAYGRGAGYVMRKHRFPFWYALRRSWAGPAARMMLALLRFRTDEAGYHWAELNGRVWGWVRAGEVLRAATGPEQAARSPDARPRVLHVITLSDWGGAQAHVLALARGFRHLYDVTVACGPGGPLVARLQKEGIRTVEIPGLTRNPRPLADLATLVRLSRWMRRERFALVHCHSTKAGLLGRVAARAAGIPAVLFTAHGWPFAGSWWPPIIRALLVLAERAAARFTTTIICVSHHDREAALRAGIGPPERLVVIPNGIAPEPWLADSAAEEGGRGTGEPCTAVMVGRFKEPKDPVTLVNAWARVGAAHRLLLVGDGPMRPEVEALVRKQGLEGRVAVLGARDDVPVLLRSSDIFVLSSRWEGMPLAVIEAMMGGLPVVATDVGGVSEAVVNGETGLLVPPGNADALSVALDRLLTDPALRRRMGEAGRRRALEHFTEERMLAETAAVYERALSVRARPMPGPASWAP